MIAPTSTFTPEDVARLSQLRRPMKSSSSSSVISEGLLLYLNSLITSLKKTALEGRFLGGDDTITCPLTIAFDPHTALVEEQTRETRIETFYKESFNSAKATVFDEDTEILKAICKLKTKETTTVEQIAEGASETIRLFAGEDRPKEIDKVANWEIERNGAHENTKNEKNEKEIFVGKKDLIRFLLKDPRFRKSIHLWRAMHR